MIQTDEQFNDNGNSSVHDIARNQEESTTYNMQMVPSKTPIYESVPIERINLKMFQQYQFDIAHEFNIGNLCGLAHLVNKCTHSRSIFRVRNPAESVDNVGVDSLLTFYASLLEVFPDGIILVKKGKTFQIDQFYVVQVKIEFTGTQLSRDVARSLLLRNFDHAADFMTVDGDIKMKLKALEDQMLDNGQKLQLFNKATFSFYIDLQANRIVLSDLNYKVTKFRGV